MWDSRFSLRMTNWQTVAAAHREGEVQLQAIAGVNACQIGSENLKLRLVAWLTAENVTL